MKACHYVLCSSVPPLPRTPQLLESQKGCGLPPAGQHCCSPSRSLSAPALLPAPPPPTHPCVQTGACGEPEGTHCHVEPGALGTAGAWGCDLWPWGQHPESSPPELTGQWGGEPPASLVFCACQSCCELVLSPQPDTMSPVTLHPGVPTDRAAPPSIHDCAAAGQV